MIDRIIAIDAMGGDFGPAEIVPAAVHSLKEHENLVLTLVGNEDAIRHELTKNEISVSERLKIEHAPEVVEMHEAPALAMKSKNSLR